MPCLGSSISLIRGSTSLAGHSRSIKSSLASAGDLEDLINFIISSILETAIARPTRMCALSLALFSLNLSLLVTTSSLKSIKQVSISLRFITFGEPLSKATRLAPNDD